VGADHRGDVHRSGCFHDAKCDDAALKEAWPAIVGWNVAATVRPGSKMVMQFIVTSIEPIRCLDAFESTHRSISSLDPAMILLNSIVQIPGLGVSFYPGWFGSHAGSCRDRL
jgi:hypothetical protein